MSENITVYVVVMGDFDDDYILGVYGMLSKAQTAAMSNDQCSNRHIDMPWTETEPNVWENTRRCYKCTQKTIQRFEVE